MRRLQRISIRLGSFLIKLTCSETERRHVQHKQNLLALGREMLERTKKLGFQPEDLFTVVFNQTVLGLNLPEIHQSGAKPRVVVVECNQPDADYFADTFRAKLGIETKAYVLNELLGRLDEDFIKNPDFAITNITHLEDVKADMIRQYLAKLTDK